MAKHFVTREFCRDHNCPRLIEFKNKSVCNRRGKIDFKNTVDPKYCIKRTLFEAVVQLNSEYGKEVVNFDDIERMGLEMEKFDLQAKAGRLKP